MFQQRKWLIGLIIAMALVAVACGGGGQEAQPTEAPAEEAASEAPAETMLTDAPEQPAEESRVLVADFQGNGFDRVLSVQSSCGFDDGRRRMIRGAQPSIPIDRVSID